ncbi:hypothetical protein Pan258_46010 [Symmachiella dynata]|uniref:hypothetical protein n=1 Tax=Symmachiella dynata TaxID=2527995 RepID=UPI00118CE6F7|nr:hypothetical protein [Symmachiella dynata]QDT50522.1 hypothetical protein Pan258_46010 [Symmachiella dynata]
MKISGPCRNRYMVSIYLADDMTECPISDRLSIPLIRLFGGTILAENDRMAAARVWFDQVGRFRQHRLEALGAPVAFRDTGANPLAVANQLIPSSLSPDVGGYLIDNGVEAWLISTRQVM